MSVIKNHQLESTQSYHNRGIHGYGRRKPNPQSLMCASCGDVEVKDEGDCCGNCIKEDEKDNYED